DSRFRGNDGQAGGSRLRVSGASEQETRALNSGPALSRGQALGGNDERRADGASALPGRNDERRADGPSARPARARYRALQRAVGLVESRRLQTPDSLALRRRLLEWYPEEPLPYQELLSALLQRKEHREALALLERYRQQFPRDPEFALHTQARLLE